VGHQKANVVSEKEDSKNADTIVTSMWKYINKPMEKLLINLKKSICPCLQNSI
jgi:hypothetical protein